MWALLFIEGDTLPRPNGVSLIPSCQTLITSTWNKKWLQVLCIVITADQQKRRTHGFHSKWLIYIVAAACFFWLNRFCCFFFLPPFCSYAKHSRSFVFHFLTTVCVKTMNLIQIRCFYPCQLLRHTEVSQRHLQYIHFPTDRSGNIWLQDVRQLEVSVFAVCCWADSVQCVLDFHSSGGHKHDSNGMIMLLCASWVCKQANGC